MAIRLAGVALAVTVGWTSAASAQEMTDAVPPTNAERLRPAASWSDDIAPTAPDAIVDGAAAVTGDTLESTLPQNEEWIGPWGERRSLGAAVLFAHPGIGSQFKSIRTSWFIRRFIEMPWAQHHVIAVRYGGGVGEDSRGERGMFALGGFPETSLIEQLLNFEQLGGVALRGYPAFSIIGDRFHLLQTEYRFPLTRVLRGPSTVPVFFDRMYGLLFFDYGDAYFGPLDFNAFRKGTGAEILMDFTLGYSQPYSLRLGFAYGFDQGGGTQFYVNFGRPF